MAACLLPRDRGRQGGRKVAITTDSRALTWFEVERGILPATLDRFGVTTEGDVVTYPYPQGTKYRRLPREFWWEQGSRQTLFNLSPTGYGPEDTVFITEGETDAMRLDQELRDHGKEAQVVALPGIEAWKPEFAAYFAQAREVLVIVDNDADYNVQARVDSAWLAIRRDVGIKAKRVRLPGTVKDVCEYFAQGFDLDDLRTLIATPVSRYSPLDLTDPSTPRPVDWMVRGLLGKGHIGIAFGEPGSGKSWLSLSLAVGVLQGWETWLGLPLEAEGKVLYIDEENPEDVVLSRLGQLGLRNQDLPNLRFLHEQNIRLDREPDAVLEEALGFGPELIVVDALTRVHTKNENDAGEMSALFNDGIKPLARQTGAAVLFLHHANKVTDGNSYRRMRGSVDIGAAYDMALEVQATGPQRMTVKHFKTRRGQLLPPISVQILDQEEGTRTFTRLVSGIEAPPPF